MPRTTWEWIFSRPMFSTPLSKLSQLMGSWLSTTGTRIGQIGNPLILKKLLLWRRYMARRYLFFITLSFFVFQFYAVKAETNLLPEHETSLYFNIGGSTSLEPTITQWGTGYSGGGGDWLRTIEDFFTVFLTPTIFTFLLDPAYKGPSKDMFHLIFLANGKFPVHSAR